MANSYLKWGHYNLAVHRLCVKNSEWRQNAIFHVQEQELIAKNITVGILEMLTHHLRGKNAVNWLIDWLIDWSIGVDSK